MVAAGWCIVEIRHDAPCAICSQAMDSEASVNERRIKILQLLADGRTPAEISVEIGLTRILIFKELDRMKDAWGAGTTVEVVIMAERKGLLKKTV